MPKSPPLTEEEELFFEKKFTPTFRQKFELAWPPILPTANWMQLVGFGKTRTHGLFPRCKEFEKDFYRCTARLGALSSQLIWRECWREVEDLQECMIPQKTDKRLVAIAHERDRQNLEGREDMPIFMRARGPQNLNKDTRC